ncbi:MAG: helix-turn-helix transcriptional regulator [Bacillota bacterium]|nr:helix-turn-helix transcriptional regulator [Bacillota bacterium]
MLMNPDQGALTEPVYYILLSLQKPLHGYGIMQEIQRLTKGRLVVGPGTLYGALTTLSARGWIEGIRSPKDSRRKEYIITSVGKVILQKELRRLKELVTHGEEILGG